MQTHLYDIVCNRHQELYDYVLNWMARLVQFPARQGEVAIVMKGVEGCGKGMVARALHHILGQHALHISHTKHLVGAFNAHLRDAVFLFADEAFYAGDIANVGALKALITEPTLAIEGKGQNVVLAPNFLHVMMASNSDWVVPAGLEARRFLVLLVSDAKIRQHAYFAAIQREMKAGGYEAMLYDLLAHDITGFDVRDVPDTDGLREQKKLSLGTPEKWWMDVLHRGYVWKSKLGFDEYFGQWHEVVTTEVLFDSYSEFVKSQNERHPMSRETFGAFIQRIGGTPNRPRQAVVGEHITDVTNAWGDPKRHAALIKKPRSTGYQFGTLAAARAVFDDLMKLGVHWAGED